MTAISMSTDEPAATGILLTIERAGLPPVSQRLAPGRHRIGRAIDNDIVLFDEDLDALHLELEIAQPVRLRAIDGPVRYLDGTELAPGALRLHGDEAVRFTAGRTRFFLDLARPLSPVAIRRTRLKTGIVTAVGFALFLGLLGSNLIFTRLNAAPIIPPSKPTAVTAAKPLDARGLLPEIGAHLGASHLDTIDLKLLPDGSVRAGGHIAPSQEAAWREVEHWFDGAYGGRAVLVDQVDMSAGSAPLAVQAARPGTDGYVIDGDGNKLFVGAIVKDGWRLESIGNDRLLLRRDAQTMSLRF